MRTLIFLIPVLLLAAPSNTNAWINSIPVFEVDAMPPVIEGWKWAALTIAQEASSEPFETKVGVAEVIRNRTERKIFSKGTIASTVLFPLQFSGWNTNDPNRARVAELDISSGTMQSCIQAYRNAFEGKTNLVLGATLFHADWVKPDWALSDKVKHVATFGRTLFYTEER